MDLDSNVDVEVKVCQTGQIVETAAGSRDHFWAKVADATRWARCKVYKTDAHHLFSNQFDSHSHLYITHALVKENYLSITSASR